MQDLILERTAKTPQVEFMALERKLTLAGRSIPENSIQFYGPLLEWVQAFCPEAGGRVEIHVKLEYFNTVSYTHLTLPTKNEV